MTLLLLNTKLYPPQARADRISRPRLTACLDDTLRLERKLTLICAPAGSGKTTLLADWLASRSSELRVMSSELSSADQTQNSKLKTQNFHVTWLSLDAGDNDPARFWSYVIAAIETVQPGVGGPARAALAALQPPPIDALLTVLLNACASLAPHAGPIVLVLDDYHVISRQAIHDALLFLLDHLPPQLRLVITSRADPPLPLARLRARGELAELRADDLRFTPAEAAAFLGDGMGLALSAADVAALEARTEGWIAGLHLAALALRDHANPGNFVAVFAGSNRFVIDYLMEEVFSRQPPHLQTFLLQTAILDRLCGPLCDALLGLTTDDRPFDFAQGRRPTTDDSTRAVVGGQWSVVDSFSQLILDQLERANLFLVPLDNVRQWYRYHQLFAEALRERLRGGATATEVAALHRRASAWHERHDLLPEAVQHALAVPDFERAAGLIEQCGLRIASRGQSYTVIGWMRALPERLIRTRPLLCFVDAVILMNTNQIAASAARLADAERCLHAAPDDRRPAILGQVLLARANLARLAGDIVAAATDAGQALGLLPETPPLLRAVAMVNVARAYQVSGDVTPASERRLLDAIAATRQADNPSAYLIGLLHLGHMQTLQGRRRRAAATYAEAFQGLAGHGELRNIAGAAAYYISQGEWLRESDDLDEAERQLEQGLELVSGPVTVDADTILFGAIALALLRQARGDGAGALAALDMFEQVALQRAVAPRLRSQAAAARARLRLMQDEPAAAARWADAAGLRPDEASFARELEYLTLARVQIAQGQAEAALALLGRLLRDAEAGARLGSTIEIFALQALAQHARGDLPAATAALTRALALAEPEGYVRLFVDEGAPMAELLRQVAVADTGSEYVRRLSAAFPSSELRVMSYELDAQKTPTQNSKLITHNLLVEPLSERELEVLRLIAAGQSNQEIAATLVIAVSTVKKHINNLYGKLEVQSRTQALVRARALHLL